MLFRQHKKYITQKRIRGLMTTLFAQSKLAIVSSANVRFIYDLCEL